MTAITHHYVRIWKEDKWPNQWIGMCRCGKGIRCNSGRRAEEFFEEQGCAHHPQTPADTRGIEHYVEQHRYRVMRQREEALRLLADYEVEHGEITQVEMDGLEWIDVDRTNGS